MSAKQPKLELVGVVKEFPDGTVAVDGIDLEIAVGETVALLGPSGCGKSSTLNMIVGLDAPTAGDIRIDGRSVLGVPAGARNVGLVFQDYAVFTHMTVRQNLEFGLKVRKASRAEIARATAETAELLDLGELLDSPTRALGGSELQRVAIGRTLATKPSILLLDEPLSNLEPALRLAVRQQLRRMQAATGQTIIYVTHDQVEALSLAHRIAVMQAGKICQFDTAEAVYGRPDHTFVASFLGSPPMNLLRGRIAAGARGLALDQDGLGIPLPPSFRPETATQGEIIVLGVRPELVRLTAADAADVIPSEIVLVERRGPETIVTGRAGRSEFRAVVPAGVAVAEGEAVGFLVAPENLLVFDGATGRLRGTGGLP